MEQNHHTSRRKFLGTLTTGAATVGIAGLVTPFQKLHAEGVSIEGTTGNHTTIDPDEWFKQIKGKHRIVFDATNTHQLMPFVWPKVFLLTNAGTGTPEKDCSVVVVLRHEAIAFAFEDRLWAKYKFGELFKANELGMAFQAADAATAASFRNPLWQPKKGDFKVPGFGDVPIGINEL